jgi:uncharacterized membrane protein YphA (DoxX/SURF4 family)
MNDSMAHPGEGIAPLGWLYWKTAASWVAATVIAILFLSSGIWKISDPHGWAVRLAQAKVPAVLSLPGALFFGITETVAGVLILVPRLRRWGALLASLLLVAFLIYFAIYFNELRGMDCSCFPWLKRVVGPGFFIGDGAMLALAVCAGVWAKRPESLRTAVLILSAVTVFALVSYGVAAVRQTGVRAPATIQVNGQPYSLEQGRHFLFFFHPGCSHCTDAAKRMSKMDWGDTKVVAIPVEQVQFAVGFLEETGLKAGVSLEFGTLGKLFGYTAYPFGVAIENGRGKTPLTGFEGAEPEETLRKLGLVH